jgi:hypothetical protein
MLRCLGVGLITAATLLPITAPGTHAARVIVTQVDKNADGTMTYHFSIKIGQVETMEPGAGDARPADFVTIYNFTG